MKGILYWFDSATYAGRRIWFRYDIYYWEHNCYGFSCWWFEFRAFWIFWGQCTQDLKVCLKLVALYLLMKNGAITTPLQGFYRNHMEEVIRFFEMHHKVALCFLSSFLTNNINASQVTHFRLLVSNAGFSCPFSSSCIIKHHYTLKLLHWLDVISITITWASFFFCQSWIRFNRACQFIAHPLNETFEGYHLC